jgi:CRISPR-associated protein Csb2
MKPSLCISFRFIQPYPLFHGRGDGDMPEWPPSPLRAFQAMLNAASLRTRGRPLPPEVRSALQVLEVLRPDVVAPRATLSTIGHRAYVPHNHMDLVTSAWDRGNSEASIASHRVEKDHRPHRLETIGDDLPTIHYLYPLDATNADPAELLNAIRPSVRSITHLGWGIDQVIGDASLIEIAFSTLAGERWSPTPRGGGRLRVHRKGSLDALTRRHDNFLSRLVDSNWTPVPPLSAMDHVRYRRAADPLPRPCVTFRLVDENQDSVSYPQSKLIHIAGMVRHLAIELMKRNPPRASDLRGQSPDAWVASYVAGHRSESDKQADAPHAQLSFIPLQSINPAKDLTDPSIRRVMIVAPIGDDAWLNHLAQRLDNTLLKPDPKFPDTHRLVEQGARLELIADRKPDGVRDAYTRASRTWASTTPVILPGHDDKKDSKTRKLIEAALQQSGIDQPCTFEWSAFSHFRKMLSAHKYVRDDNAPEGKRRINYIRPDHLLNQTGVHLTIRFEHPVPGPITIGAGRHCGFGVMVGIDD